MFGGRLFLHLSLIILFAFTQISLTAHSFSHLADHQQPAGHEQDHQQDQDHHDEENCGQCLTYKIIADADLGSSLKLGNTAPQPVLATHVTVSHNGRTTQHYSARAPPTSSQA